MRRAAGLVLCVSGSGLLMFAGGRYTLGVARAEAARREWNDAEARRAIRVARAGASHRSSTGSIAAGALVARLMIPRLDLDEIVLEGVGDDELNAGPGHLPGSALPGALGNAVISAHRDRHFSRLDALRVGDTIRTETADVAQVWVVVNRRVIDRDAPALFRTRDATLTLTTCWPIRFVGPAPERLIVTARPAPVRTPTTG